VELILRDRVHTAQARRYTVAMHLSLDLPDELSAALAGSGRDPSRAALEAIALEAYRQRKISTAQLRRLLGFSTRYELDGFLKEHEVWLEYTARDLEHDLQTHRRLDL
jgi:predicted HTH domain antitoxin